jgi:serine/threonine protein kinase
MEIEGYKILGTIGCGGMGVVYLALEKKLDRMVALKVLNKELCNEPGFRSRFLREIHVLARLKHANLVPVFEGGIQGKSPHFSMAYIKGRSLNQVLEVLRKKRDRGEEWFSVKSLGEAAGLSVTAPSYVETILWWVLDLAEALDYVHRRSVLHLDLKPSNVLITPEGDPVLLDFGVSQILNKNWGRGEFTGTPSYMAPERLLSNGKEVGKFSDAYSLAVILFELLTLDLPVPGRGVRELSRNHRNEVLKDPRALQSQIPIELAQILRKALAKEPQVSYLDLPSFARDLRCFLKFEPIQLPGIPLRVRLQRVAKKWRRPLLRVSGALVLGICLLVLFFFEGKWQSQGNQTEREAQVQAFSFLALGREALARRDLIACGDFLRFSKEIATSPDLERNLKSLEGQWKLEREREVRRLQAKVLARDGEGIDGMIRRVRPFIQGDPKWHPLLVEALELEREEKERIRILSLEEEMHRAALFRLACDLSKGVVQEGGRLSALRKTLKTENPPPESLLCVWAGGWSPWEVELKWGIRKWSDPSQFQLLFLLAFDRREPYASWALKRNKEVFSLQRLDGFPQDGFRVDFSKRILEAERQGATEFVRELKRLERFLGFYQRDAFRWPWTVSVIGGDRLFQGLQLRLAWGMPMEEEEGLRILRKCPTKDKQNVLWVLYWSRKGPPSRAILNCLSEGWQKGRGFFEGKILSLLALWDPQLAWEFFQKNGLIQGWKPLDFGFLLKILPQGLTRKFQEEVLRDPASPWIYREGLHLLKQGIRIPPLLPIASQECDPRILSDALVFIQSADRSGLPLLRRFSQSPFPHVREQASKRLRVLEGK